MPEDMTVNRGEDKLAAMKAQLDAKLESLFNQRKAAGLEVAGPPGYWDLYAVGPYQSFGLEPGRVIQVGESATVLIVAYLNPFYPNPAQGQNACDILTGHGDKIEFHIHTANLQTMQPVPSLSKTDCIFTTPGQCWYTYYWTFTPQEAACLLETNICAHICNCANQRIPQYSGFVRWVENLDFDYFFPPTPGLTFDHPIRFMVANPQERCVCVQP